MNETDWLCYQNSRWEELSHPFTFNQREVAIHERNHPFKWRHYQPEDHLALPCVGTAAANSLTVTWKRDARAWVGVHYSTIFRWVST